MKIGCGKYSESQWQDHLFDSRSSSLTSHLQTCPSCQHDMGGLEATILAVKQTPLDHAAVRTSFVDSVLAEVGGALAAPSISTTPDVAGSLDTPSRPRSWKFRLPNSWREAIPILAMACVAFFVLWTSTGALDLLFPVKSGTPITNSPVTFQLAAGFDIQPLAEPNVRTFTTEADMMGTFAAEADMMGTFAAEADMMGTFAAEGDMMGTFAAEGEDFVGPMFAFSAISFIEEPIPLATPDGVTSASAEEWLNWSLVFRRLPNAMPIYQPSGVTTNWQATNDIP